MSEELYIEFDGAQLVILSDVDPIIEFVRATYRHMLVDRLSSIAGRIDIWRTDMGFKLQSVEPLELTGDSCEPLMPYLKEEILLQFMRTRPDLLWIHAGAVERNGRALLIAAASGQGKSTLTTLLLDYGWRLMSDDVAPVRMDTDEVLPFYQAPLRRLDPGMDVPVEEVSALQREAIEVPGKALRHEPAHVGAIVFPVFARGKSVELTTLKRGDGALELLRNARNFVDHKGAAVARAATFARSVPMFQLYYGSAREAVMSLENIL
jgi:hypothetical protein